MKKKTKGSVTKLVDAAEDSVKNIEQTIDSVVVPARKSLLKRFPITFTLLVTFGVSTTFLGLEQLVVQTPFLYERPLIMLCIGIGVLAITGTLYKKLG